MNLFFDTSALLKRYIDEKGSDVIDDLFQKVQTVFVSEIALIECHSALKRLNVDKALSQDDMKLIKNNLKIDFQSFNIIDFNKKTEDKCIKLFDKYQIKTLDCIHFASLLLFKNNIDYFVSSDTQLIKSVKKEGIKTIDPERV